MIKANRDENVFIKEIDRYDIHVRLNRVSVHAEDPVHTRSETQIIQIFNAEEFEKMQKRHSTPDEWVKIAGFVSAKIVHDGRLETREEVVVSVDDKALQEVVDEKIKAAVKKEEKKQNIRKSLQKPK